MNKRLTEQQRREIRTAWADGEKAAVLAEKYGVGVTTIYRTCKPTKAQRERKEREKRTKQLAELYHAGELNKEEALSLCEHKKSTFYNVLREVKEEAEIPM